MQAHHPGPVTIDEAAASAPAQPDTPRFRPVRLVASVLLALLAVSAGVQWYAREVSLPRYCANPERALARLREILTETRPAGDGPRRDYVVSAKLIYLVPRGPDEPLERYLDRVRARIAERCG